MNICISFFFVPHFKASLSSQCIVFAYWCTRFYSYLITSDHQDQKSSTAGSLSRMSHSSWTAGAPGCDVPADCRWCSGWIVDVQMSLCRLANNILCRCRMRPMMCNWAQVRTQSTCPLPSATDYLVNSFPSTIHCPSKWLSLPTSTTANAIYQLLLNVLLEAHPSNYSPGRSICGTSIS